MIPLPLFIQTDVNKVFVKVEINITLGPFDFLMLIDKQPFCCHLFGKMLLQAVQGAFLLIVFHLSRFFLFFLWRSRYIFQFEVILFYLGLLECEAAVAGGEHYVWQRFLNDLTSFTSYLGLFEPMPVLTAKFSEVLRMHSQVIIHWRDVILMIKCLSLLRILLTFLTLLWFNRDLRQLMFHH